MGLTDLSPKVFEIDPAASSERLCAFIREKQAELRRDGIVVPFSGGLDSSTVLLLCARAVGKDQVTALLMPERQGNPEAELYARRVTDRFGIKTITRDISPVLARLGTYHFILSYLPSRALQDWVVRRYLQSVGKNAMQRLRAGTADALQRKGLARINSKHRIRAVTAYLVAEERNWLVVGCAHKSEDLLGLFVKFGVDDSADLMPLKNLHRSQILQIAAHIGVPAEILGRSPNPDIVPGVSDKYMDILGLPSATLDLIVYGIEQGMDDERIAESLSLPGAKVQEIRQLIQRTAHMRSPSQSLAWG